VVGGPAPIKGGERGGVGGGAGRGGGGGGGGGGEREGGIEMVSYVDKTKIDEGGNGTWT